MGSEMCIRDRSSSATGFAPISMLDGCESKFFAMSRSVKPCGNDIYSSSILNDWKKESECICLDVGDDMNPVIMSCKKVMKMKVEKVIHIQIVDNVLFRISLVSDNNNNKFVTCGAGSRNGVCKKHVKVYPGTHCPVMRACEIDVDVEHFKCTCPQKKTTEIDLENVPGRPSHTGIPAIKYGMGFKRSTPCNPVEKVRK